MEGNLKFSLTVRGRATAVTKPVQIIGTNDAIDLKNEKNK
jgi:hypothetical protein